MEPQTVINMLGAAVCALGGWLMRRLWDDLKELRDHDKSHDKRINQIEVLVAGEYLKRAEFDSLMNRVFTKLDSIESKVDAKADK